MRMILDRSEAAAEIEPENFYPHIVNGVRDYLDTITTEEEIEHIRKVLPRLLELFDLLEPHDDEVDRVKLQEQRKNLEQLIQDL